MTLDQSSLTTSAGPHTDYGLFTVLHQTSEGLQILSKEDQWLKVPVLEDSFVINIGYVLNTELSANYSSDMLSIITNGMYRSTAHRVIYAQDSSVGHRMSIPYFFDPSFDSVITPLSKIRGESVEARFSPRQWSIYIREMYEGTYAPGLQS